MMIPVTAPRLGAAKLAWFFPDVLPAIVFQRIPARTLAASFPALVALLIFASGCGPSNRLREVSLNGQRVAVTAAIPPHPRVQAGSAAESGINPFDPIGSIIRVGTAAEKRRNARHAQARLDSVVARVDIADRIARQVLVRSADALRFIPASRPSEADMLLDLRIVDYALVADSFEGDTYFILLGEMLLMDPNTGEEFWRTGIEEREVLDASWFGLGAAVGNVITGRALANLSAAEMETGLMRLSDIAAGYISDRLRRDYARSRDDYNKRARTR